MVPRGRDLLLFLMMMMQVHRLLALDPSKPIIRYGHDVWGVNRGFPYFAIHAIHQTRDGYLWLATDEGLVRFDGVQFTPFDENNTNAITHNDISSLAEDSAGNLWIGTRGGGLCRLSHGKFTRLTTKDGLSGDMIQSLCLGNRDELWIGYDSFGLSKLSNGTSTKYLLEHLDVKTVYTLFQAPDGTLFFSVAAFGLRPAGTNRFELVPHQDAGFVKAILQDRNGVRWIGGSRGLFTFDGERTLQCTLPGAPVTVPITCLCEDREHNLWVGTEGNGLYRLAQGVFTSFSMKEGLSSDRILSLAEDREGNLWIGTRGGGLNCLRDQSIQTISGEDGLSGEYITAVYEDRRGSMWLGVKDYGVDELRNGMVVQRYALGGSAPQNYVRAIEEDASGNILLGTMKGLFVLKKKSEDTKRTLSRYTLIDTISDFSIRSIVSLTNGDLLLGTYGSGLWKQSGTAFTKIIGGTYVRSIAKGLDGTFWIASKGSVTHLGGDKPEVFTVNEGLSTDEVFALHCDDDGTVWIGTYGGGLNRLKQKTIVPITKKDGLFDNVIYAILDDGKGNFWMSCNKGIFRVRRQDLNDVADKKTTRLTCISYGVEDGMKGVECNGGSQPSGWKTRDGNLVFPTVKGIVLINPGRLRSSPLSIDAVVELMIADGDTLLPDDARTLPLGKRRLEINYTGITFLNSEKLAFRYQLEGVDGTWIDAGNRRQAYYTNLSAGTYTFKVSARLPDRDWSREAALPLVIPPYVWETVWFRVAVVLTLLLLVYGTTRYLSTRALRQQLRELEAQQALERERARISQDMHDEVGASLTQIAILSELLERNITRHDVAISYVKKISTTAQDVVGSLDEIVWFINPRHDTLESLLLYLREYLADYFEPAEIRCRFDFPAHIPAVPLPADVRRTIFLVVKEAAHNIIKHSGAAEVFVQSTLEGNDLHIVLEDDGRGLDHTQGSMFGNGLKNMQKRMNDIGGVFAITSSDGHGAIVSIKSKVKSQK